MTRFIERGVVQPGATMFALMYAHVDCATQYSRLAVAYGSEIKK